MVDLRTGRVMHHTKTVPQDIPFHEVKMPERWAWWAQLMRQNNCRKEIGHCYHSDGWLDWFCCECGKWTDGTPDHNCRWCRELGLLPPYAS